MPKPKPSTQPTIALTTTDPRLGQPVVFACSAPGIKNPRVEVVATQTGEVVWSTAGSVAEAESGGPVFKLGGDSSWWLERGGPASCVAKLYEWVDHPSQH